MRKINLSIPAFVAFVISAIVATGATRFMSYCVPELSNFTALGAIALFGGACLNQKWKPVVTVALVLFVTNIFINYLYVPKLTFWTSGSWAVYVSFIAMVFIGGLMKKINVTNVMVISLASVLLHWLITDIEPWLNSPLYAKGIAGYFESLIAAIPFERNMLIADGVFGAVLFGGYQWLTSRNKAVQMQKPLAA
ncbi:hypothetical protein GCM10027037_08750 [Mucilaginibacter koreensis]